MGSCGILFIYIYILMFVKITIIKSVSIFITIVIINNIANCGIVVAIKLFVEHQYIYKYIYIC